jgi:hypothetical protein
MAMLDHYSILSCEGLSATIQNAEAEIKRHAALAQARSM